MKSLLPFALLALAALSPAPIYDSRPHKPVPERSESQVLSEMRLTGAYKPVGSVPKKTEDRVIARDKNTASDARSVATASAAMVRGDDTIARASAQVQEENRPALRTPVWLLLALAAGGAFGIVRGLRAWADKALPTPRR